MVDHSIAPHPHQCILVQAKLRYPPPSRFFESAPGNQYVKVSVEFQVAAEGVRNNHDERLCSVLHADPLLKHASPEVRQIVEEVSVTLEDRPEFSRHREDDTGI